MVCLLIRNFKDFAMFPLSDNLTVQNSIVYNETHITHDYHAEHVNNVHHPNSVLILQITSPLFTTKDFWSSKTFICMMTTNDNK